MDAISYTRTEVKSVIGDSLALVQSVAGEEDPNDHTLQAVLPSSAAPFALGTNRPLLATATSNVTESGSDKSLWTVLGGYLPGHADAIAADVEFTYTPDKRDTLKALYGALQITFRLPTEEVDVAQFHFQLDGSRALPLAATTFDASPGGAGDVFSCVLKHGANAVIPTLLGGLTGLSAGPAGFLAAAAATAAGVLPQAVSGAIGCFEDDPCAAQIGPLELLAYPVANVEQVLDIKATEQFAAALDPDRCDNLVCASEDGLFRNTGQLLTSDGAATSISGRLSGEVSTMPTLWQYTAEVTQPTVNVTLVALTEPKFEKTYRIPIDEPNLSLPPCGSSPSGFDLACLISAAGGPVLTLVRDTLPELKKGVTPFLRALLDGAGNALGSSVTNIVRQCLGGKAPA